MRSRHLTLIRNIACRGLFSIALISWIHASYGKSIDLSKATIGDFNAAFDAGTLTSKQLVQLYLDRIAAYEDQGPALNSIIYLNPDALDQAAKLDAERNGSGPRSPMHGIPVILKDNHDTYDMPTTGGSVFLEGSMPPNDAFIVKKLREAGAIILAKANMSEFASSARRTNGFSSFGGQTLNPHDLARGPSGSSGGSGSAVAAWFSPVALGTDTGGSVRNPCAANGIAGLKPTRGLMSRDGIIPLGLSFDTAGPMCRSVYDVAVALGVMSGVDSADAETLTSIGKYYEDYTQFLDTDALKGARLGVFVDYEGNSNNVLPVFQDTKKTLESLGATLVEIELPSFITERGSIHNLMRPGEFKAQVEIYLATLDSEYPKTLEELIELSKTFEPGPGQFTNLARWEAFEREFAGLDLDDPIYLNAKEHGPALIKGHLLGLLYKHELDAFIYPTNPVPAQRLDHDYDLPSEPKATSIANITGFPDMIVPAGVTKGGLPVTLSFLGADYSEPRLLALAYAFEQTAQALKLPATTPALPGETFSY